MADNGSKSEKAIDINIASKELEQLETLMRHIKKVQDGTELEF